MGSTFLPYGYNMDSIIFSNFYDIQLSTFLEIYVDIYGWVILFSLLNFCGQFTYIEKEDTRVVPWHFFSFDDILLTCVVKLRSARTIFFYISTL